MRRSFQPGAPPSFGDLRSAEVITRRPLDKHKSDLRLPYIAAMVGRLRARYTRRAAACYMFDWALGRGAAGKLSSDIHAFVQFLSLHLCGDETGHICFCGEFAIAN